MKRKELQSSIIKGLETNYQIDGLFSEAGGSCLVYRGHYIGTRGEKHSVLIKELYPAQLDISRENDALVIADIEAFELYKSRFVRAYQMQNTFHEKESSINTTSNALAFFEQNNTCYIVMSIDRGKSLQELMNEKQLCLKDILEVLLSVSKTINHYHNNEYLHLDLKPDNVFILEETFQLAKLFDFDSIAHYEDLKSKDFLVPSSEGYSAPEQIRGDIYRINIKSDFFAIGNILFRYVMKQAPESKHLNAAISYEIPYEGNEVFQNVNPAILKKLKAFFGHTVQNSGHARFENDKELIIALEELLVLSDPKAKFLISNFHPSEKYFVGRNRELEEIHTALQKKHVVALRFLGGIGKTSIAKEYAKRNEAHFDNILYADYTNDIKSIIIDDSKIPINNMSAMDFEKDLDTYYSIKFNQLQKLCNERTLIIIDALNTLEDEKLKELLTLNCKFIISTRCDFSFQEQFHQIVIERFDQLEEAYALFKKYYKHEIDVQLKDVICKIIEKVDRHPLIIELLSMSISATYEKKARKILYQFLEDSSFVFASEKLRFNEMNDSAQNIIQKIFDISQLSDDEKNVLMHMSLIPPIGLNREYVEEGLELENGNIINELCSKGWLTLNNDMLAMHQVISDTVYKLTEPTTDKVGKFLGFLNDEISDNSDNLKISEMKYWIVVLEHLCHSKLDKNNKVFGYICHRLGDICNKLGLLLSQDDQYDKALEIYTKYLATRDVVIGKYDLNSVSSYNNIGSIYFKKGDYDKSLKFWVKALEINEVRLGKDHIDTASSYNNIGSIYSEKENYDKALEYYKKALEIREVKLVKNHPNTAISYNNIGSIYLKKGDYDKALECCMKVLEIRELMLGKEHPNTALAYNNIGSIYCEKGDYNQALEFYKKALAINEVMLGIYHPDTAISYNNIGFIYSDKGDYDKALDYYKKALEIREVRLGKDHPDTASSYENIGSMYSEKGDYDKALEFYMKYSAIIEGR